MSQAYVRASLFLCRPELIGFLLLVVLLTLVRVVPVRASWLPCFSCSSGGGVGALLVHESLLLQKPLHPSNFRFVYPSGGFELYLFMDRFLLWALALNEHFEAGSSVFSLCFFKVFLPSVSASHKVSLEFCTVLRSIMLSPAGALCAYVSHLPLNTYFRDLCRG